MKKIGYDYYNYKGYEIYKELHPQLVGKYEIFLGCVFIKRALNLKEAKQIILTDIAESISK